eukprot:3257007-Ditylum_brightwellii.AAC.1
MKMLSAAYGNLLFFYVKPEYIFSTDNTMINDYEDKGTKSDKFRLVSRSALSKQGFNLNINGRTPTT